MAGLYPDLNEDPAEFLSRLRSRYVREQLKPRDIPIYDAGVAWANAQLERQDEAVNPQPSPEQTILQFLAEHVFEPVLSSETATADLKSGVRMTRMRLEERDAAGMIQYFWSAVIGTEKSVGFAAKMKQAGFTRFEEVIDEFRERFNDQWLRQNA